MFNYNTLLDELQETISVLKAIPNCCIIFNHKAEVIEINKHASKLLKINNIENFNLKQHRLVIEKEFLNVTESILNGKIISDEIFHFNCEDNQILTVKLKATKLVRLRDVFIFEFYEIVDNIILQKPHHLSEYLNLETQGN